MSRAGGGVGGGETDTDFHIEVTEVIIRNSPYKVPEFFQF